MRKKHLENGTKPVVSSARQHTCTKVIKKYLANVLVYHSSRPLSIILSFI
jgi:hypothetical protein